MQTATATTATTTDVEVVVMADKEPKEAPKGLAPIWQMFRFATGFEILFFVIGIVVSIANGTLQIIVFLIFGQMFDSINISGEEGLNQIALYFVYAAAATIVSAGLQVACFSIAAESLTKRLRGKYLDAILSQEIAYFDMANSGALAAQVAENTLAFREAIGDKFGMMLQFASTFISGFVLGFFLDYDLALVILATSPLLVATGYLFMSVFAAAAGKQLQAYAKAGSIAEETLSQIRTVAGLTLETNRIDAFQKELVTAENNGIREGKFTGLGFGATMLIMFSSYGLGFFYGSIIITRDQLRAAAEFPVITATAPSFCVIGSAIPQECSSQSVEGLIFQTGADICNCPQCGCGCWGPEMVDGSSGWKCATGGSVVTTFFAVLMGAMSLGQASPSLAALTKGRAAAKVMYSVIDRKPTIFSKNDQKSRRKSQKDSDSPILLDAKNLKGEIVLEKVHYTYISRPDMPLFVGLNLDIPAGKTVALVGESGSGKSTVISLIERFYDPNQGRITFDGVDIRELDPEWYRSLFGYVGQEPTLFAASIKQNIMFGVSTTVTDEQIENAAKAANAHDFICSFPNKYDTIVGGNGSQLSGGQKQRIAIARALVRDPKVLLLDEATSALDNESERVVQAAIDEMISRQQRTTIVVAHRLTTVKNADKIVVLGKGKVIEQGSHSELMDLNGTYAALINIANKGGVINQNKMKDETETEIGEEMTTSSQEPEQTVTIPLSETPSVGVVIGLSSAATTETTANSKKAPAVSLSRAFKFAEKEKYLLIPSVLFAALNGTVFPIFSVIFANVTNVYFLATVSQIIAGGRFWSLMFLILGIGTGIAQVGQNYFFGIISARVTSRVRARMFSAFVRNEIGFFDLPENSVGGILTLLSTDASLVKSAIVDRISFVIMNTVTIISGFVISFTASWQVSLVVMAIFPLLAISSAIEITVTNGLKSDEKALAESGQVLTESILGIRTVTALGIKDRVVTLYSNFLSGPMRKGQIKGLLAGMAYGIGQSIPILAYALSFWYGGSLIAKGTITFTELLQSFFGIVMMSAAIGQNSAVSSDVSRGGAALRSVFAILDRESLIDPTETKGEKPSDMRGDVEFKNVSFNYPARPTVQVLKDFSLTIHRGETVAMVGASGSGKSTIVLLLERFYDPLSGSIKVDGIDLKTLNVNWLRTQLGYVGQEPQLFVGTIEENIRNGRQDATKEEIIEAAKSSNVYDFIMSFPDKFETQVGAKGTQLSGGQKQRIAIARAILRNPRILLLDEATSALDGESEAIVQAALDDLLKKQSRTTIIVAHRLSTVRNANNIVVLDKGVVVEQGTYDELMGRDNGAFAKLYAAQKKHT